MLRSSSLLLAVLCFGAPSFAQDDRPEYVGVTGSKIWPPAGPVWAAEGPSPTPGHGCAEPNCGESPQDPGGGGATTQKQKDEENKRNKEKAKAYAEAVKNAATKGWELFKGFKSWFKFDIKFHTDNAKRTVYPDGRVEVEGPCTDFQMGMGASSELPCVTIKGSPEQVKRNNGVIENQLRFTFEIYELCFYQKTCGRKYLSFVAGSEQELSSILNEITGSTEF
jgi:hypothetical protein